MPTTLLQTRVEAIRRLARRGAGSSLRRSLEKSRPEDIAAAMAHLAPAEQRLIMSQIGTPEHAAEVLPRLAESELHNLARSMKFEDLLSILEAMEVDDEADVIAALPDDLRVKVLEAIQGEEKEQVEEILAWPDDSAGGIMQPLAFRVNENVTCREAIESLQGAENIEMVFYLYAENDAGQLVGVTSLRNLLTHSPSMKITDIMTPDVIAVHPSTDQEEVARIVSRYDLLAVPVIDEGRRLIGIVTIDDVIDVIKEEALEDMMLMAGMGDAEAEPGGSAIFRSVRQRLPWLLVTIFGGIGMAELIGRFEGALAEEAVLAGFIPVMMGMGGNVGIQAATIAVRNIATGRVESLGVPAMLFRELRVGALMGVAFATVLGAYAVIRHGQPLLGFAIAISTIAELIAAATFGSLVPTLMARIGVDPAVATGPFVTTGIDMVALTIYFSTCVAVLQL